MKDNKLICAVSRDPVTVLLFGAFPAIAATDTLKGGLAMGLTVTVVMVISAAIISLFKGAITEKMLLPVSAALSTFLAAAAAMLLNAWFPGAYEQLGIYVSLMAVALLIFGSNSFAYEKRPVIAVKNAVLTGLFYTVILVAVAIIRELFGSGSVFGAQIGIMKNFTDSVLVKPAGGFLIYAFAAATVQKLRLKKANENKEAE